MLFNIEVYFMRFRAYILTDFRSFFTHFASEATKPYPTNVIKLRIKN